jgi:hypothetical protein
MKLSKLLSILGLLLIIYAVISGLQLQYSSSSEGSDFDASYSFKIGTFLLGVILFYLDRKKSN